MGKREINKNLLVEFRNKVGCISRNKNVRNNIQYITICPEVDQGGANDGFRKRYQVIFDVI